MENQKTVLLVEDDESFRESLRKLLAKEGFEVLEASSGEEGMELLEKHRIDLIVLDLYLGGMTGMEFLEKTLRPGRPPVVMVTAFGDWNVYSDALALGAVDCLAKPVKRNDLMSVIAGVFDRKLA
jgi:DNA-binding response OmpR family regulator